MNRAKQLNRTFLGKIDGKEVFIEGSDQELIRDLIGGQALEIRDLQEKLSASESIIAALEVGAGHPEPEAPRIIVPGI